MPVDRPTFSESWYRVSALKPSLRSGVQVHRQHFRGQMWHVVQDPASNQFFRLNDPAYHFVGLLDGRRTVADAWAICNEQLGDSAPTQGEAIQLLGQLYTSNLLRAELPPDAEGLFQRYNKRVTREIQGYLMNFMFLRIPLYDPDHLLDRWVGILGKVFTLPGAVAWLALVGTALYLLAGHTDELWSAGSGVLDPANLPLLYLGMLLVKVVHEFGHAFACKKFGQQNGTGGEVHVMGVMFLVFTPLPYVDASSSWSFRQKWHRFVVGGAGMIVEIAVAAVAAIVWVNTNSGALHSITYNMMFVAGVSTILFNANPLLRYDGYYMLSDVLEIANLSQRGKTYLYYLVRKYAWGVRRPQNPAHTAGERFWLPTYGVLSAIYRIVVCVAILLFVAQSLFMVGVILAVLAAVTWVLLPLGKLAHYLATHGELDRVRVRAVGSMLGLVGALVVGLGVIRVPDHCRVEGLVEPTREAFVHAEADGFVRAILVPSGQSVLAGEGLLQAENPELESQHKQLLAERARLEALKRRAEVGEEEGVPRGAVTADVAAVQALREQLGALDEQLQKAKRDLAALTVRAPVAGMWISPEVERMQGAYMRRGDRLGLVAGVTDVAVRGISGQDTIGALRVAIEVERREDLRQVELCVKGRPDLCADGRIVKILEAGQRQLPSPALGQMAGGSMATSAEDRRGMQATEDFFEIRIVPDKDSGLMSGQRVVIRAELPSEPLMAQWWRSALRLFQRRFEI